MGRKGQAGHRHAGAAARRPDRARRSAAEATQGSRGRGARAPRGGAARLLAVELRDGLLRQDLVGVGDKRAAAALAVGVAQDVQLQDLADGREEAVQLLLGRLRAHARAQAQPGLARLPGRLGLASARG